MNASSLLTAAEAVLTERGRCTGSFHTGVQVDVMGALAVAAGLDPDVWADMRDQPDDQIEGVEALIVEAARHLCRVALPGHDSNGPINDLVGVLGDWQDTATDAEIGDALTKAAHNAQHDGKKDQ